MTYGPKNWLKRITVVAIVAVSVSGCAILEGNVFEESFWASSPFKTNDEAELGIAELAKGNFIKAEGHFQRALATDSRDIDALLGAGILYQNTGQFVKAREMYEAVLAIRPEESRQFVVWNELTTRPASQVASVNLSLLETGGTANVAMPSPLNGAPVGAPIGASPETNVLLGRAQPQVANAPPAMSEPSAMPSMQSGAEVGQLARPDANIVSRFSTLRALRDQGLITQEEYTQRRQSNIGALLPITSPPPAAGLDRPVPGTEQISARLRAIGRALEMRAISVSQHSAERGLILDAMMPSAPVMVAPPAVPPSGLLQAADSIRRLEILRDDGFITSDEYARERQAIELAMQATPTATPAGAVSAATSATGTPQAAQPVAQEPPKPAGPQPAVHLASYRSAKQAESGWVQIRRAHSALLSNLDYQVSRVTLGSKGTYFRLKAGPLPTTAAATDLCRQLKQRRQFCDASVMNGG